MTGHWTPRGSGSGRPEKQGYAFVLAFHGHVQWIPDSGRPGKVESCWHKHRSPSAARKCAEAAAARWNRSGYAPKEVHR